MKIGDHVLVYRIGQHGEPMHGIVIAVAGHGNSIAVTLMPEERHICAHRDNPSAPWIDLETGGQIQIL